MQLSKKSLEELRNIINGDGSPDYRSGPKLVEFFNNLGFHDNYGQGFPSRWQYTDEKLKLLNGTSNLDKCIKQTFAVIEYVGRIDQLDSLIEYYNQYLAFDKYKIIRVNDVIIIKKLDKVIVLNSKNDDIKENDFLKQPFVVNINHLGLAPDISEIISMRIKEAELCVNVNAPLSTVIMIGSILEGILLGIATTYPQKFNQTLCAPKDETGKVRKFQDWTLNNFIDAASEIGFLKHDVKKFSHVVRDFRNYIHPYSQLSSKFSPDRQTALICLQVLKAAICQIGDYRNQLLGG